MFKTFLAAAGFAAVMLLAVGPGYCGGTVGCAHDQTCRGAAPKSVPYKRIETVKFSAAGLLRNIVDTTTQSNKPTH